MNFTGQGRSDKRGFYRCVRQKGNARESTVPTPGSMSETGKWITVGGELPSDFCAFTDSLSLHFLSGWSAGQGQEETLPL